MFPPNTKLRIPCIDLQLNYTILAVYCGMKNGSSLHTVPSLSSLYKQSAVSSGAPLVVAQAA